MERLKMLRSARGVLQKDIAALLGIDRTTYVKYEKGVSEPSIETLLKLADYFGVSVDFLLGREDEDTKKEIAALPDDDLNSEIISLLTSLFPGREEFAFKTLQTISEIPEEKHELALGMLQVLKDHEA